MRRCLFLLLLLVLAFPSLCLAQGQEAYLELAGEPRKNLDLSTGLELDEAFDALLDGDKDGKLVLLEDGQVVFSFVRSGNQVTLSSLGIPDETATLAEMRQRLVASRAQGMLTACKANLKNIGTACEMWYVDHDGAYPESLSQLTPEYLKRIPQCPASGTDTYTATYRLEKEPVNYRVNCTSDHFLVDTVSGYPAYDGERGLIESPPVEIPSEP